MLYEIKQTQRNCSSNYALNERKKLCFFPEVVPPEVSRSMLLMTQWIWIHMQNWNYLHDKMKKAHSVLSPRKILSSHYNFCRYRVISQKYKTITIHRVFSASFACRNVFLLHIGMSRSELTAAQDNIYECQVS